MIPTSVSKKLIIAVASFFVFSWFVLVYVLYTGSKTMIELQSKSNTNIVTQYVTNVITAEKAPEVKLPENKKEPKKQITPRAVNVTNVYTLFVTNLVPRYLTNTFVRFTTNKVVIFKTNTVTRAVTNLSVVFVTNMLPQIVTNYSFMEQKVPIVCKTNFVTMYVTNSITLTNKSTATSMYYVSERRSDEGMTNCSDIVCDFLVKNRDQELEQIVPTWVKRGGSTVPAYVIVFREKKR